MFLTMERAYGGAGSPWPGSAGFKVLPGGKGKAGGDVGASRLQALNLLFRKCVAPETSWSLSPAWCSATPDFPRPRVAVTADRDVRARGRKPKAGFAGFARSGRNGLHCLMALGPEQPQVVEQGEFAQPAPCFVLEGHPAPVLGKAAH